jgi:hypothetical protein
MTLAKGSFWHKLRMPPRCNCDYFRIMVRQNGRSLRGERLNPPMPMLRITTSRHVPLLGGAAVAWPLAARAHSARNYRMSRA